MQVGFGVAQPVAADQDRHQCLPGLCRAGLDVDPEAGGLAREVVELAVHRDLGGAAREPGVAGTLGDVEVSLGREAQVAALTRDLAHQQLVQDVGGQGVGGQYRRRLDRTRGRFDHLLIGIVGCVAGIHRALRLGKKHRTIGRRRARRNHVGTSRQGYRTKNGDEAKGPHGKGQPG